MIRIIMTDTDGPSTQDTITVLYRCHDEHDEVFIWTNWESASARLEAGDKTCDLQPVYTDNIWQLIERRSVLAKPTFYNCGPAIIKVDEYDPTEHEMRIILDGFLEFVMPPRQHEVFTDTEMWLSGKYVR